MSGSSVAHGGHAPPFTVAQWAEMEHQALIFKYLKAGVPVPSDLLSPIRNSVNLISPDFLRHHPALGYTYCGKKLDPEPGRCRRSDGKKWRCSKDAHPDSKYCERHMNRGRYRSRKLVESKPTSQSSSTVTSDSAIGSSSHGRSFQNMPLHSMVNSGDLCFGSNASQLKMEPMPYGISSLGHRGRNGAEEHNFMSESSRSARCLGMDNTIDSPWRLMAPHVAMKSELRDSSLLLNNSSQLGGRFEDIEPLTIDAAITKQQKQQYAGGEYGLPGSLKHEHSLQPFFDEWPKSRDLGFHLNDHRPVQRSNAMAPSEFYTGSPESPDDAYT